MLRLLLLLALAAPTRADDAVPPVASKNAHLRGNLDNSRLRFEAGKGHVAFLGGSITEMEGYRPMVMAVLKQRFPKCDFTFTNAGVASTCSTTGAFRLADDVLSKGPVDLLFVEFAVNDDQDAHHARRECVRGMEGIVRHLRDRQPAADIVMTHFVNEGMLKEFAAGRVPTSIAAHEAVAEHYGIPSINLAREVSERIAAGKLTWGEYGGVHPARPGNALAAGMIAGLLDAAWKGPAAGKVVDHAPVKPLDSGSYAHGRFIPATEATLGKGWEVGVPEWSKLVGQCRQRFIKLPLLHASAPGAELTLPFEGQAVGAYILAGPDSGQLEAAIDGGPATTVELFHAFSKGLHYPRTVVFATDLKPGKHTLALRVAATKNPGSVGTAARIVHLLAD